MKRRDVLGAMAVAGSIPLHTYAQSRKKQLRVGWNPLAGAAAISLVMQNEKLVEKAAAKMGQDVEVLWIPFLAGPASTEALVASRLDIDLDISSATMTSRIRNGTPFTIIGTHASHLSNAIMVRPGSPVNDVKGLIGKTVALPIGTSAHYTLASIVANVLGKTLAEAEIRLVNMPVSDGIKMPSGIDAAVVWVPTRYLGPQQGTAALLVDADGLTGAGHKTPGKRLAEVQRAWGWPEGFFIDRMYASCRDEYLTANPAIVQAFLEARWTAQDLVAGNFTQSLALANSAWKLPPDVAKKAFAAYAENTNIRNIPLTLEADVLAIVKTSEFFKAAGLAPSELSWKEVLPVFFKGKDIQKAVWASRTSPPSVEAMKMGFKGQPQGGEPIQVLGGAPLWENVENWGARLYKPGPFAAKT